MNTRTGPTMIVADDATQAEVIVELAEAEFLLGVGADGRGWLLTADQDGEPFAVSYEIEDEAGEPDAADESTRRLGDLDYPVTVVTFSRVAP